MTLATSRNIAVIGLGYVGLPVAIALSAHQRVIAFDKNATRIAELKNHHDRSQEVNPEELQNAQLHLTSQTADLNAADFYIVAVPTPIDANKQPDLTLLKNASETVGKTLKPGDIVVYESTVYPGATEEVCAPILEKSSGLQCGTDFNIGYSPERINPSDKEHRLQTIVKVVSAQNPETLNIIAGVYERVVDAGIYRAPDIKTAEAAKIIENTQRDLNIALMNELALIFDRMHIDTHEVIKAARTKWNFLPFTPGLVGGHCIGVDPYYLTYQAQQYGYEPEVILAGRRINDNVGKHIAKQTLELLKEKKGDLKNAKIAVLGITFKENCNDIRNSKAIDIIQEFIDAGVHCIVHDARANPEETKEHYHIELTDWDDIHPVDAVVLAVPHQQYCDLTVDDYKNKLNAPAVLVDVKSVLNKSALEEAGVCVWRL